MEEALPHELLTLLLLIALFTLLLTLLTLATYIAIWLECHGNMAIGFFGLQSNVSVVA